jgi:hypothetical protein
VDFQFVLKTSLILRVDILLAGNEPSLWRVAYRVDVQRRHRWKSFRSKPNRIPAFRRGPKSVRLPPGILFAFIPELCSGSAGNAVRLHPEIPFAFAGNPHLIQFETGLAATIDWYRGSTAWMIGSGAERIEATMSRTMEWGAAVT